MTKLEIIEETVKYYSEDTSRRSTEEKNCVYLSKNGNKCAFSRCCTEEGVELLHKNEGRSVGVLDCTSPLYLGKEIDDVLKPEYKGHSIDFWRNLQDLHDSENYWDSNGLTKEGLERLKYIKQNYINS